MTTQCALCRNNAKLLNSHIIPKFVFNWMKSTGTKRLRSVNKLKKRIQDGPKVRLLCENCENKFSKYEKRFKERVFEPYLKGDLNLESVDAENVLFIVSVLWRALLYANNLPKEKYEYQDEIDSVSEDWRNYLDNSTPLNKSNFYIYFVPEELNDLGFIDRPYTYLHRGMDIQLAEGEDVCFIYVKFAKFILVGDIVGDEDAIFENCNINKGIKPGVQKIKSDNFIIFINSLIEKMPGYDDLPIHQKKENDSYYKENKDTLDNSEYMKAWRMDNEK